MWYMVQNMRQNQEVYDTIHCKYLLYSFRLSNILHHRIFRDMIFMLSELLPNKTSYSFFIPWNHFFALSLWWGHHGRQQGLFLPFPTSSKRRWICCCLVSAFLTIVTRQIRSLRARGVSVFRFSIVWGLRYNAEVISSGSSWRLQGRIVHILILSWTQANKNLQFKNKYIL